MKKTLLTLAAALCVSASQAGITMPANIFESDFLHIESLEEAGWVTYSNDAPFNKEYSDYFGGAKWALLSDSGYVIATSCTNFENGEEGNQWLITPEFTVTDDNALLCYTACAMMTTARQSYSVLVSPTGGAEQADFDAENPLFEGTITGSSTSTRRNTKRLALNDYKGKKIRIAFVNKNKNGGLLGFSEIAVAPYFATISNKTDQFVYNNDPVKVTIRVDLSTPVSIKGLKATLTTADGQTSTYETVRSFSTTPVAENIAFADEIKVGSEGVPYTVTITPNMEGVQPIVVTGAIIPAEHSFPATALIEEQTGSWCQYCPMGIAYMNYYHDHYTGEDGTGKAIGVAVHYGDLMADYTYYNPYCIALQKLKSNAGYPYAMFNRSSHGVPQAEDTLKEVLSVGDIMSVDFGKSTLDKATGMLNVNYTVIPSFSSASSSINAGVILVENDVKGDNDGYNQQDAYASFSSAQVEQELGTAMLPYLKPFVDRGQQSYVPYTEMVYQEVARGIFPSYEGESIDGEWKKGEAHAKSISLQIPETVMNVDNTEIIVFITDSFSGKVLTANRISTKDAATGIDETFAASDDISLEKDGDLIRIRTAADGVATLYSVDGRMLSQETVSNGEAVIDASAFSGIVLMKIATPSQTKTVKVLL